jgi:hypothetical protein
MAPRSSRLAELRALRKSGKTLADTYEVEEENQLYDVVDDEDYKKIVRKRLDEDDFVVDDNGEGYADDGREEWDDRRPAYDSDSGEDDRSRAKSGSYAVLTVVSLLLHGSRQEKTRGRTRKEREDQQWHQQVFHREDYYHSSEAEGVSHCSLCWPLVLTSSAHCHCRRRRIHGRPPWRYQRQHHQP